MDTQVKSSCMNWRRPTESRPRGGGGGARTALFISGQPISEGSELTVDMWETSYDKVYECVKTSQKLGELSKKSYLVETATIDV